MEIQLQDLIEQIKKDGVDAAEAKASAILENASVQAEKIIADAKAQAEKITAEAKIENERLVRASEDAIKQAGRNLLISFRESVKKELDVIIGNNVKSSFSQDKLSNLIVKAVDLWIEKTDAEGISVLLGSDDLNSLERTLLSALKEKLSAGVMLKADDDIENGFRIAVNNGNAYYDYSAEAVTQMLSAYLNPRIALLMKEAEE